MPISGKPEIDGGTVNGNVPFGAVSPTRVQDDAAPLWPNRGHSALGRNGISAGGVLGIHLSPLAGRGRERSERVRGTLDNLSARRIPLTPTLSLQAGRGSTARSRCRGAPRRKEIASVAASVDRRRLREEACQDV